MRLKIGEMNRHIERAAPKFRTIEVSEIQLLTFLFTENEILLTSIFQEIPVVHIRGGNRDNLGIIFIIFPFKHIL